MGSEADAEVLPAKLEGLLALLYANPDHAKLQQLLTDVERLRQQAGLRECF